MFTCGTKDWWNHSMKIEVVIQDDLELLYSVGQAKFLKQRGFFAFPITNNLSLCVPEAFAQHKKVNRCFSVFAPGADFSNVET